MSLSEKKELVHRMAESFADKSILKNYNILRENTVRSYHNDQKLSLLSSHYDVRMMPQEWQEEVIKILSSKNFIIVLVDKMLHRDPIALSMYEILYQNDTSLIIEDEEIFSDRGAIRNDYLARGGDYYAKSEMNAEKWLTSPIGESYLYD